MYEFDVYTAIYLIATLMAGITLIFAWARREAPGGLWLVSMLVAGMFWTFCEAMDSSATTLSGHVVWAQFAYFGAYTLPMFLLLFALEYSGRPRLHWSLIGGLMVVPVVAVVAAYTNPAHHLIWTAFTKSPRWPTLIVYHHGWLYWVVTGLCYLAVLAASIQLASFALRNRDLYRYQSLAVLGAVAIPFAAEIVYDLAPSLLPGLDPSVTLSLSAALLSVGMLQYRLLDLAPVAREILIERLEDGVLVFDADRRLLDANPSARHLLGIGGKRWVGTPARTVLAGWPEVAALIADACEDITARVVGPDGRHFALADNVVRDTAGRCTGTVAVLRDVTDFVNAEEALQEANTRLHERIAEIEMLQEELREQAVRDALTGLYNRRYLTETLEREIGRAQREHYPVSVIMLDADHFKDVNDLHGHAAGDQVLRFLGAELRAQVRPGDIACRFGGDEFVLVLPNTLPDVAAERAEEWRASVASRSEFWMPWSEATTISVGVAAFPGNGSTSEEVMAAADAAVYEAKAAGRDRVVLAHAGFDAD